jgi:hypothetical protein
VVALYLLESYGVFEPRGTGLFEKKSLIGPRGTIQVPPFGKLIADRALVEGGGCWNAAF